MSFNFLGGKSPADLISQNVHAFFAKDKSHPGAVPAKIAQKGFSESNENLQQYASERNESLKQSVSQQSKPDLFSKVLAKGQGALVSCAKEAQQEILGKVSAIHFPNPFGK